MIPPCCAACWRLFRSPLYLDSVVYLLLLRRLLEFARLIPAVSRWSDVVLSFRSLSVCTYVSCVDILFYFFVLETRPTVAAIVWPATRLDCCEGSACMVVLFVVETFWFIVKWLCSFELLLWAHLIKVGDELTFFLFICCCEIYFDFSLIWRLYLSKIPCLP